MARRPRCTPNRLTFVCKFIVYRECIIISTLCSFSLSVALIPSPSSPMRPTHSHRFDCRPGSHYPTPHCTRTPNHTQGQQPLLQNGLNVDLRYRATYANPFLRTSNAANPTATPAPPPYPSQMLTSATRDTATTSGLLSGATTIIAPLPTSSSSGHFILPANGSLKKGSLATHV